ncbi:MAG: hypothetical protein ACI81R_000300 [Bradymonadia bacterium]|jgi:hypothetical protein
MLFRAFAADLHPLSFSARLGAAKGRAFMVNRLLCAVCFLLVASCEGGEAELDRDPDGDGVINAVEEVWGTNPNLADTDGDGLGDLEEIFTHGTTPTNPDTDGDGANDGQEIAAGTDPLDADTDNGGIEDGIELEQGRDPFDAFDDYDQDSDGLTDVEEGELGTDPNNTDSDADGVSDYDEVRDAGSDPLATDSDGDTLDDRLEYVDLGTDPTNPDTDGDTLDDGREVNELGTDPLLGDTDGDGLTDDDEVARGTDPLDLDSDDDGLDDRFEVEDFLTDPLDADSDDDELTDPRERIAGTDPNDTDSDDDGLLDGPELDVHATEPLRPDTDDDRLSDGDEVNLYLTLPLVEDTDEDGLTDGREVLDLLTNPLDPDTDADGLDDFREVEELGTDPLLTDTDLDGVDDRFEVEDFLTDPLDTDTDDDALSDGDEFAEGTNPNAPDSDLGGVLDGAEVEQGRNPLDPSDDEDSDRDGVPDADEVLAGTDPNNPDSDGDGLTDLGEANAGSDPLVADTDGDGLEDGEEVNEHGSNPNRADSDSDELGDFDEVRVHNTDPAAPDTDLDGLIDGREVDVYMTDPLDADSDDDTLTDGLEVFSVGSDPNLVDSDDDGLVDADEFEGGTNPQNEDSDGDDLTDIDEIAVYFTNPLLSDTDQDGIPDDVELFGIEALATIGATDPLNNDTDGDGMRDGLELSYGVNPLVLDSDGDGIDDGSEVFDYRTDPAVVDTDLDRLPDGAELVAGTDPLVADTDGDGLDDGDEVAGMMVELTPGVPTLLTSDPLLRDTDGDLLTDMQEMMRFRTNPRLADTDSDTLTDKEEVDFGFDPNVGGDGVADPDDDGLSSREEFDAGTSPIRADSDLDQLNDGDELLAGTDPLFSDTDGDTLSDGAEVMAGSNPLAQDSDLDGLLDNEEREALVDIDGDGFVAAADPDQDNDGLLDTDEVRLYNTDERLRDTDGDEIGDGLEILWGLDPLDPGDALRDADDDQLSNLDESRRATDATNADTDGDGIPDGVEVNRGLNPLDPLDAGDDFDGDGITNYDEVCPLGVVARRCEGAPTDARGTDSDGDGLADSLDTAPTNPDRDGDGLTDGEEVYISGSSPDSSDSDLDGISDGDEFAAGGDPVNNDRDGDALTDDLELAAGTNPGIADTDGDGLNDFQEQVRGVFVTRLGERIQVFPSPLQADTDGDGLDDGFEAGWGTDPTDPDTDNDGLSDGEERDFETDPLGVDTDADGIPDGLDPSPVDQDADGDGLPDVAELVDGYNARIFDVEATGEWVQDVDVSSLTGSWFRVFAVVRPATVAPGSTAAALSVQLNAGTKSATAALRWEGTRVVSTAPQVVASGTISVNLDAGPDGYIERVVVELLSGVSGTVPVASIGTFADRFDSDGDGLDDRAESGAGAWVDTDADGTTDKFEIGTWVDVNANGISDAGENAQAFWLEAEHFAEASAPRVALAGASGGRAVRVDAGAPSGILFGAAGDWGYVPGVRYAVFLRAQVLSDVPADVDDPGCDPEDCPNYAWVTVERGDSPVDDCGGDTVCAARLSLTNQLEWRYAGTYTPGDSFVITVRELLGSQADWLLDRVAILPMTFAPEYDVGVLVTSMPAELHVPGVSSGTILYDIDLPWGASDPQNADTDGDGYRAQNASCLVGPDCLTGEVAGTTGWLTDGFELQTLGSNPFDIDSDRDADVYPQLGGLWGGDGVFDVFGGAVRVYTDALDPFPVSMDRDLDGIENGLEERLWTECQTGGADCPNLAADGVTCVSFAPSAAQVLCWADDDDRDNDGLPDGQEDRDQDGLVGAGETDPNRADTDGDGVPDGAELGLTTPDSRRTLADVLAGAFVGDADATTRTNALSFDSDGDGLCDGDVVVGNCVAAEDVNTDGRYDASVCGPPRASCGAVNVIHPTTGETLTYGTPARAACETDASRSDTDGDGLSDRLEVTVYCTDPNARDTDGDGLEDRLEVSQLRSDPNVQDTDGDGLADGVEFNITTGVVLSDLLRTDTDDDGLTDFEEISGALPSDPYRVDTDGDGLDDFDEVNGSPVTDPSRFDSDGDGLSDLVEQFGEDRNRNGVLDAGEDLNGNDVIDVTVTNPNNPDTDGDDFRDGEEVRGGSDPNDPNSGPSSLDDAGGLEVGIEDATLVREVDPVTGDSTGVLRVSGDADGVPLSCPGRPSTAYVDGDLILDRSNPTRQRVFAEGDFYLRLPGNDSIMIWSGRTEIIGADAEGNPTNTAVAYTPDGDTPNPFALGAEVAADISMRAGAFFDVCEGELGGLADWRLGDNNWALVAGSEVAIRPGRLGMSSEGQIGFDTPIGPIYLLNADLEVNLLDFYASGSAGLEVPGLGDLLGLFPGGDDVDGDSETCPICLEFEIDVLNGRFAFRPSSGYAMSIGPLEVSVDGPEIPMPEFEIDISRGYIFLTASFAMGKKMEFEGSFEFDMAGQIEFEPASEYEPLSCSAATDCLFGQFCEEGECQGCAGRFDPVLASRFDVTVSDAGAVTDQYVVDIAGQRYTCPAGETSCRAADRIEAGTFSRTFQATQTGRFDEGELADALGDAINAGAVSGCGAACDDAYRDCAILECGLECGFDTFGVDCGTCAAPVCGPERTACNGGCSDAIEVEAYVNDDVITIESDTLLTDIVVTVTVNGAEDEDVISAELAEAVNGNLAIDAAVTVPLKIPTLSLTLGGQLFLDTFPVSEDADPPFVGLNGEVSLGVGLGPVSLGVRLGGATAMAGLNELDELDFINFTVDGGITLDDFADGLPSGLGSIGQGQSMIVGFDVDDSTLCGEGQFAFGPWAMPMAFNFAPPVNPVTNEFDNSFGGMDASFQLSIPLLDVARAEGVAAIGWDGDFLLSAELELDLLPGMPLGNAGFELSTDRARVYGDLELPGGIGSLSADGVIEWNGQFDLSLEGELSPLGFELATVTGRVSNAGVELAGRIALPGDLAVVDVVGYIRSDGDFYFQGTTSISIPGGATLANATIRLSNDGLSIRSSLNIPGVTEITVEGEISSDGYIFLSGSGSIGVGDALRIGPITLSFERTEAGVYTIEGSGVVTIAGINIAELEFSISTSGAFSARGRIDLWIAEVDVFIEKSAGGSVSFEARASFSVSALSHTLSASIAVGYASGALYFEVAGGISGPILNASISLRVDTNGCFSVGEVGRFCL